MGSRPVRIKEETLQWLELEGARAGVDVPSLVNDILERTRTVGLYAERGPVALPPGWSGLARDELEGAPIDSFFILTFHAAAQPWPYLVAGFKKEATSMQVVDLEIHPGGRRMFVPRVQLVTWHRIVHGDYEGEVLRYAFRYQEVGVRLHPSVALRNRAQHGLL